MGVKTEIEIDDKNTYSGFSLGIFEIVIGLDWKYCIPRLNFVFESRWL